MPKDRRDYADLYDLLDRHHNHVDQRLVNHKREVLERIDMVYADVKKWIHDHDDRNDPNSTHNKLEARITNNEKRLDRGQTALWVIGVLGSIMISIAAKWDAIVRAIKNSMQ